MYNMRFWDACTFNTPWAKSVMKEATWAKQFENGGDESQPLANLFLFLKRTCRSGDGALIQQELVKRPVLPGCFDGIFRASWAMSHKQKWPSWLNFPIWIENWPRWLASKRQANRQTSSLVTRPDQSLAWANLVYSHCVCVGVFANFAEKPHQTDVPTDIKGNCEEPTTTLRESSYVSLCKSKQIQYASVRHLTFFV